MKALWFVKFTSKNQFSICISINEIQDRKTNKFPILTGMTVDWNDDLQVA